MPSIFDDERRGGRSKAPDPCGTGPLYAPLRDMAAASRMSCVGPAPPRHPRLPPRSCGGAKSGSPPGRAILIQRLETIFAFHPKLIFNLSSMLAGL